MNSRPKQNPSSVELMNHNLEQLAKDCGKRVTNSELLFFVYETVHEMPFSDAADHLRSTLSDAAIVSVRHAARSAIQKQPDATAMRIGWITPEAPARFIEVPMKFIRQLASI